MIQRTLVDESCTSSFLYLRQLGHLEDGSTFYDAEACGWYQMYQATESSVSSMGVDVFVVWFEAGELRVGVRPASSARSPIDGEMLTVVGPSGVVCHATVVPGRTSWPVLDKCPQARDVLDAKDLSSVVAVRDSDATRGAVVRHHNETIANNSFADIVLDLVGDDSKRVEVWCRDLATGEFECERLMVERHPKYSTNVWRASRVRWWPRRD